MRKVEVIFCCCFECEVEQSLDFTCRALQGHRQCIDSTIAYLSPGHCTQERKEMQSTGQGSLLLANCSSIPGVRSFPSQSETPAQRCSTTPLWHMRKTAVDLGLSRFGLTAFNCRDRAPRPVGRLPCRHIVIFCRTECHQALESVLLQSRSLGHSSGCFSYFVPIVFYSPIAARES